MTMAGDFSNEDQKVDLDFTYVRSGDAFGTFVIDGLKLEMRSVGEDFFVKGDSAYWGGMGRQRGFSEDVVAKMQEIVSNKWVRFDSGPIEGLDQFDRQSMLNLVGAGSDLVLGGRETIDGVECLSLTDSVATLYVDAKSGLPVSLDTGEGNPITFTYDGGESPGAPADVFDFESEFGPGAA
ncbi:hypothetical protein [Aeromicrobium panaciterrae]|uniref:hypothetical protein n=1 Tax=Aeromicrobium panaciterrae TaxID=363861 RepID=UPI0031E1D023